MYVSGGDYQVRTRVNGVSNFRLNGAILNSTSIEVFKKNIDDIIRSIKTLPDISTKSDVIINGDSVYDTEVSITNDMSKAHRKLRISCDIEAGYFMDIDNETFEHQQDYESLKEDVAEYSRLIL